jgi:hypothetical protein
MASYGRCHAREVDGCPPAAGQGQDGVDRNYFSVLHPWPAWGFGRAGFLSSECFSGSS